MGNKSFDQKDSHKAAGGGGSHEGGSKGVRGEQPGGPTIAAGQIRHLARIRLSRHQPATVNSGSAAPSCGDELFAFGLRRLQHVPELGQLDLLLLDRGLAQLLRCDEIRFHFDDLLHRLGRDVVRLVRGSDKLGDDDVKLGGHPLDRRESLP